MEAILDKILNQKRKNGSFLISEEGRKLITFFKDFSLNSDFIEGKDLTKIEKLLLIHLVNILEIKDYLLKNEIRHGIYNLVDLTERVILSKFSIEYTFKNEESARKFLLLCEPVKEIKEKIDNIRSNRTMKNGVLPKEFRLLKQREEIKGKLDPIIKVELEKITERFKLLMVDFFNKKFIKRAESLKEILPKLNLKDPKDVNILRSYESVYLENNKFVTIKNEEQLLKMAIGIAELQSQSFFFKMADKLGGLVASGKLESVGEYMNRNSTPFDSFIRFTFKNGSQFIIKSSIVINCSPLGNYFYQYPTTFHDAIDKNGNKIKNPNELIVKKAFLA